MRAVLLSLLLPTALACNPKPEQKPEVLVADTPATPDNVKDEDFTTEETITDDSPDELSPVQVKQYSNVGGVQCSAVPSSITQSSAVLGSVAQCCAV
jgi:hypothetical protein